MRHWSPYKEKKTTGYGAYAVWQAVMLHFSGNLNLREYRGRVSISRASYSKSPVKIYESLAKKWTTNQLLSIYTLGFSRYNITYPGDIYDSWTLEDWQAWPARWAESPEYWFRQEVRTTCSEFLNNADDVLGLFRTRGRDDYPAVLTGLQAGALSPESALVLNRELKWIDRLEEIFSGDLLWEEYTKRLTAYSDILVIDDLDWRSAIQ